MPTGVLLILLNRWIPESPRFLLATGRRDDAQAVLDKYGAVAIDDQRSELLVETGCTAATGSCFTLPSSA